MKRRSICTDPSWHGRADCVHCAIRNRVLFADLPPEELDAALIVIDDLVYSPNSVIYREGEEGDALFTIRRGMVKLVRHLPGGEQRIVRLLGVADALGLEAVIGSPYRHTAIALGETEVCRIPLPVINRLGLSHPELSIQLMVRWQRSLDNADHALVEFSTGTAEVRVARLLLQLSKHGDDATLPEIGRQDMGSILGITTETTSRVMAEFKRRGVVEDALPGDRLRCDVAQLATIAGHA
ncbi:MAG: Crp/Fnr family transcriptional regulator [Azonexus sp.]